MKEEIKFLLIDLFCGFGGTTLGFLKAKNAIVMACVNHDANAIKSHWRNHPEVEHFNEDITKMYGFNINGILFKSNELIRLQRMIDIYRALYPNAKVVLWASLECTNFSNAKGGLPRDADSRTLANHLFYYLQALCPDMLMIENVVEFMAWGPMRLKAKKSNDLYCELAIIKDRKSGIEKYGYEPISRKSGEYWNRWKTTICNQFGFMDDWRELNSADFGAYTARNRLFGIFATNYESIAWPVATHAKKATSSMFGSLEKYKAVRDCLNFNIKGKSIFNRKKPLCENTFKRIYQGLLKTVANGNESFVLKYNSMSKNGKYVPSSIEEPSPVVATQNRLGLVSISFLQHYYGNGFCTPTDVPCPTLTTKDRASLVEPVYHINRDFKNPTISSIEEPAGSITTVPKLNLVEAQPFILNPSWGGHTMSIEKPSCVVVASQHKAPLYIIQPESGLFEIPVFESDSETVIKIKKLMAFYNIKDITMRMLMVKELLKIQGFPEDYKMAGTQTEHKKFIGNSVEPNTVAAWVKALGKPDNFKLNVRISA